MEIEHDEWLYVEAIDENAARRFFGAPNDWPVELHNINIYGGKVWRVKAEGLD